MWSIKIGCEWAVSNINWHLCNESYRRYCSINKRLMRIKRYPAIIWQKVRLWILIRVCYSYGNKHGASTHIHRILLLMLLNIIILGREAALHSQSLVDCLRHFDHWCFQGWDARTTNRVVQRYLLSYLLIILINISIIASDGAAHSSERTRVSIDWGVIFHCGDWVHRSRRWNKALIVSSPF